MKLFKRKEEEIKMTEKEKYFFKQRMAGLFFILLGIICFILSMDLTVLIVCGIIGASLILTNSMVWMDNYFYENHGEDQWDED